MSPNVGIIFWFLSFVVLASALLVVTLKNIFHCALALVLCLFTVAGLFILLGAEFLAAAQVLIYVGAVSVLMIFAIMLTSELASRDIKQTNENGLVAAVTSAAFAYVVIQLIGFQMKNHSGVWQMAKQPLPTENIMTIGKSLMTQFMLPFEVVSVLMLAALIGAVVLAREEGS